VTRDDLLDRMGATWRTRPPPKSLQKAFAFFELDAARPNHHELLIVALADACFGREKVGRPKGSLRWTPAALFTLALHENEVRKMDLTISSNQQAAERIREQFPDFYRTFESHQLRQRLPRARQEFARMRSVLE
jgi:hypothetical protein